MYFELPAKFVVLGGAELCTYFFSTFQLTHFWLIPATGWAIFTTGLKLDFRIKMQMSLVFYTVVCYIKDNVVYQVVYNKEDLEW